MNWKGCGRKFLGQC